MLFSHLQYFSPVIGAMSIDEWTKIRPQAFANTGSRFFMRTSIHDKYIATINYFSATKTFAITKLAKQKKIGANDT